eukprot:1321219-Pleurochrysis_carterae.AAC.1
MGCARTAMTHRSTPVETKEMKRETGKVAPSEVVSIPSARAVSTEEEARARVTVGMERRSPGPRWSW